MKYLNFTFITLIEEISLHHYQTHNKVHRISSSQLGKNDQIYVLVGLPKHIRSICISGTAIITNMHGNPSEKLTDKYEGYNVFYGVEGHNDFYGIDGEVEILCKKGRLKEAVDILYQGICLDSSIYARLLQGCIEMKALREAKRVHTHMLKYGFNPGSSLGNRLVDVYAKCGLMDDALHVFDKLSVQDVVSWTTMIAGYTKRGFIQYARQMFDKMPKRNVVSWNAMIAGYAQRGHGEEAVKLFSDMQKAGLTPNSVTFVSILSASASLADLEQGKQVHAFIIKIGVELDVFVGSALLDMYSKCKCVKDAHKVFEKMPERNVVSWNAMIDAHGKYGTVENARQLFDLMPERSVVSWTSMIAGYAQHGLAEEAFNLFRQMQQGYMRADQFTYACVLSLCASLAVLERGKQAHARSMRIGIDSHVSVVNGLITMYAKCGSIEDACKVFDKAPAHNIVSWTAMISGCAMHGRGNDALQLFQRMQQEGVKPDHITFLGVLSACSHSGLVDVGRHYFDSMSREHGVIPRTDHYACMIDLLGRAGHLDVVEDLINDMPFEPDARVWAALLGVSRINGNLELGQRAAQYLFELEPQNSAAYVLLSNIYAEVGRWDDVAKVRKIMKEERVKKTPGWSWIAVKNRVHTFVVADKSHP